MNKPTIERLMKFSREAAAAKRTAEGGSDQRLVRRWAVQFTATRGEMTGTIKMGALGATWDDACQFVRTHCAGQYDSIGEITEITPNDQAHPTAAGGTGGAQRKESK